MFDLNHFFPSEKLNYKQIVQIESDNDTQKDGQSLYTGVYIYKYNYIKDLHLFSNQLDCPSHHSVHEISYCHNCDYFLIKSLKS